MFRTGFLPFLVCFLCCVGVASVTAASYNGARIFNGGSTPLNTLTIFHYGGGPACSGSADSISATPSTINPGQFALMAIPTAMAGTSETGSAGGFDTNGVNYCTGNIVWTWPTTTSGMYVDFFLYPVATNNIFPASVTNTTGFNGIAYFKLNGSLVNEQYLQPGQVANYTYHWTGNGTLDYGFVPVMTVTGSDFLTGDPTLTNVSLATNGVTQTNLNGWAGGPPPGGTGPTTNVNLSQWQLSGSLMSTSGVIRFDSTNTAAARDSTLQAGFNAVKNGLDAIGNFLAKDLGYDSNQLWAGLHGSNDSGGGVSVTVTNAQDMAWFSNYMWFATNYVAGLSYTNDLLNAAASNFAAQLNGGNTSLTNPFITALETIDGDPAGSPIEFNVSAPVIAGRDPGLTLEHIKLDVSNAIFNTLGMVKNIWIKVLYLGLWFWSTKTCYKHLHTWMQQRQVTTTGQSVLGTNLKLPSVMALCAFIIGVLTVGFGWLVSAMTGGPGPGGMSGLSGDVNSFVGTIPNVWHIVTLVFPLHDTLSVLAAWIAFELYAETVSKWVSAVILFAVGV